LDFDDDEDEERRAMRPLSLPRNRKDVLHPTPHMDLSPPPSPLSLPKTQKIGPSNRSRTQSSKKDEVKMPPKLVFHGKFRKMK